MANGYRYPSDDWSDPGHSSHRVEGGISLDTVFQLLSERRCRYTLYCLNDSRERVLELTELVRDVAAMEAADGVDDDRDGSVDDHHSQLMIEIRHRHLPTLSDANVIDYDPRSETIRYYERPSLQEWLEHAAYKERE